jgi:hypothetical protein
MSSVSSVSANQYASQASGTANFQQIQSDFKSLTSALQSGDLNGAQQAYAALKKDAPELFQNNSATSTNPLANALSALGSALQSGNLTGAQTAMSSLQQAVRGHHHHHRDDDSATAITASPVSPIGESGESSEASSNADASSGFSALA